MSKYKDNARHALERGYWVDGDGAAQGPRGPLKCHPTSTGFLRFSMHARPRRRVHVLVHQLAALILFGERGLSDDVVILHLDRDKTNNRPNNLVLGTRNEAQLLIPRVERLLYGANAASRQRLLTTEQVTEIRAQRASGATLREICDRFGIAKSTASYVVNKRTYT